MTVQYLQRHALRAPRALVLSGTLDQRREAEHLGRVFNDLAQLKSESSRRPNQGRVSPGTRPFFMSNTETIDAGNTRRSHCDLLRAPRLVPAAVRRVGPKGNS